MNNRFGIAYKIWDIVYPLLLYYAAVTVGGVCGQYIFGTAPENYLFCKMLGSILAICVTWTTYRHDLILRGEYRQKLQFSVRKLCGLLIIGVITVYLTFSLNNLILMSPLVGLSDGFSDASDALYSSNIWVELLAAAVVTPILEEMVYRGVIYRRMRRTLGFAPSVLLSALIFGMLHFNIVQFAYAFLFGLALAVFVEKTKKLYPAVIAHMLANTLAVIRTETGFLDETVDKSVFAWMISALVFVLGASIFVYYLLKWKNDWEIEGEKNA